MMVNAKIIFHPRDVVGVALHGTEETKNPVAAEYGDGQYANISELHVIAPVSYRTLEVLDHVEKQATGGPADLIDSLCIGMYAIIQFVKKLKFAKRVILITDGSSPATVDDDQLEQIASEVRGRLCPKT